VSHTFRILDANLNRASEGLRVVEDYCRMALGDAQLSRLAKELRHDLHQACQPWRAEMIAARDTQGDVGTTIATPGEQSRASLADVAAASCKRAEQAVRSLEEYGKLVDSTLAAQVEQLRYRLYTFEKAVETTIDASSRLEGIVLCVLVECCDSDDAFLALVESLLGGRPLMIQLRDKHVDDRTLLSRAERLVSLCRQHGSLAIVNDRVDVAMAADAAGVHLGQDDLSVAAARRLLAPGKLIGVSTHNIDQAQQALLDGANYLGCGPTFASGTKQFQQYAGLEYLRQVASQITLPAFAIGGIDASNLPKVLAAGFSRVAVAGAVCRSNDPAAVVGELGGLLAGPRRTADT
jgi:thiamine-phosphate pyrophosphorylase